VVDAIRLQAPDDYAWPGNVRKLEQCIRRILLKRNYQIDRIAATSGDVEDSLITGIKEGSLNVQELLSHYCALLYDWVGSYEEVARKTALDRRTVKKYIDQRYQNGGCQT
jgi:transcriptional regulator with GAF, ATPase, and Fis domain